MPPAPVAPSPTSDWLSLTPASRLLGVDPDTLRRWADQGRVESFTTPGGHRRFARRSVERLIAARRGGPATLITLGATPERLARAYARSYAAGHDRPTPRYEPEREALRRDGRRLLTLLLAHLDASDRTARERAENEAADLVDGLAARLARAGTTLADAVSLFVAARRPFLAELGSIARRRSLDAHRLTTAYDDASGLLDRLLLRLIAAHEAAER